MQEPVIFVRQDEDTTDQEDPIAIYWLMEPRAIGLPRKLDARNTGGGFRGKGCNLAQDALLVCVEFSKRETGRLPTHLPELDLSRFDVAGGVGVEAVRDFSDAEFGECARGFGLLKPDVDRSAYRDLQGFRPKQPPKRKRVGDTGQRVLRTVSYLRYPGR